MKPKTKMRFENNIYDSVLYQYVKPSINVCPKWGIPFNQNVNSLHNFKNIVMKYRVLLHVLACGNLLNLGYRNLLVERAASKASTAEKANSAKQKMLQNILTWVAPTKESEGSVALNSLLHLQVQIDFNALKGADFYAFLKSCVASQMPVPFADGTDLKELEQGGRVSFLMSSSDMLSFCGDNGLYLPADQAAGIAAKVLAAKTNGEAATIVGTFEFCQVGESYGEGTYSKNHWRTTLEVDSISDRGQDILDTAIATIEEVVVSRSVVKSITPVKEELSELEEWLAKQALAVSVEQAIALLGTEEFDISKIKEMYGILVGESAIKMKGKVPSAMVV